MLKTYDITRRKSRPTKKSKIMLTPTTEKLDPVASIPIEHCVTKLVQSNCVLVVFSGAGNFIWSVPQLPFDLSIYDVLK
jgi:hypothetical protein